MGEGFVIMSPGVFTQGDRSDISKLSASGKVCWGFVWRQKGPLKGKEIEMTRKGGGFNWMPTS